VASDQLKIVNDLLDGIDLSTGSLEQRRALMDSWSQPAPDGVTCTTVSAGGVPAEWVVADDAATDRVVMYVHGGGYVMGSIGSHRSLVSRLSQEAKAKVLNVDYRLAPEHPFPAAVEDAVAAYRWLVRNGVDPSRIVIAGDSAGGGLTLATLLALKQDGDALPAAAVPISPWTDMEATGESVTTRKGVDKMIDPDHLKTMVDHYAAGADLRNPLLSPLHGDYADLPPLLIHVGSTEVLLDDAVRVAERAKDAGVDVTIEVWDDMPHVWHAFVGLLPEADQAVARIGEFVRLHVR
jgi:monoterpene epsilon-lactone hydrolase